MENTKYISQFKKSDVYALTMRLKNAIPEEFDLIIKIKKEFSCLLFEFSDPLFSDKDFYLELAFMDNACLVMNSSGDVPFDASIVYDVFVRYCKDRFGPEYMTYIHDTAITY